MNEQGNEQNKDPASNLARNTVRAIGAVMVVMFGFVMWPLVTGGGEMEKFCSGITPGMSRIEVLGVARADGYDVRAYESDDAQLDLIADRRAMGRYICKVTYLEEWVESARYVLND